MTEKKKDDKKPDKFTIWVYVGFGILGLLLLIIIIGLLFYLFSTSSTPVINNYPKSLSLPIINNTIRPSSVPVMSTDTNNKSKYMTSLFRYGGFRNRYKRF